MAERMFVPNRQRAEVPIAKVTLYLLNPSHPDGASKAAFFSSFGFSRAEPIRLVEALGERIRDNPATEVTPTALGEMYAIDASLTGLDGRRPPVRSVWIIEDSAAHPRLVTAYPAPRSRRAAPGYH